MHSGTANFGMPPPEARAPAEMPGEAPEARLVMQCGQRNEKGQTPNEAKREQEGALTGVTSDLGCPHMQQFSDMVLYGRPEGVCRKCV